MTLKNKITYSLGLTTIAFSMPLMVLSCGDKEEIITSEWISVDFNNPEKTAFRTSLENSAEWNTIDDVSLRSVLVKDTSRGTIEFRMTGTDNASKAQIVTIGIYGDFHVENGLERINFQLNENEIESYNINSSENYIDQLDPVFKSSLQSLSESASIYLDILIILIPGMISS